MVAAMSQVEHLERRAGFRRLRKEDFPAMQRWLEDPDVASWYALDFIEKGGILIASGQR